MARSRDGWESIRGAVNWELVVYRLWHVRRDTYIIYNHLFEIHHKQNISWESKTEESHMLVLSIVTWAAASLRLVQTMLLNSLEECQNVSPCNMALTALLLITINADNGVG